MMVARAFADLATISLLQNRAAMEANVVNEQLTEALASRVLIEQAKGVIFERARCGHAGGLLEAPPLRSGQQFAPHGRRAGRDRRIPRRGSMDARNPETLSASWLLEKDRGATRAKCPISLEVQIRVSGERTPTTPAAAVRERHREGFVTCRCP